MLVVVKSSHPTVQYNAGGWSPPHDDKYLQLFGNFGPPTLSKTINIPPYCTVLVVGPPHMMINISNYLETLALQPAAKL